MFSINIYETIADIMFNNKYGRISDPSQCLIGKTPEDMSRQSTETHIVNLWRINGVGFIP